MTAVAVPPIEGPERHADWRLVVARAPQLALTAWRYLDQVALSMRPASVDVADNTLRTFARYLVKNDPGVRGFVVDPAGVYEWVRAAVPAEADVIFFGGNGLRVVGAIDALERDLGRPVLSANQVLLWAALGAASLPSGSVAGYGRLFSLSGTGVHERN